MRKVFRYIEHLWLGTDGHISLRAALAIAFSVDFIRNLSHAIWKWDAGRSLEGLSMVLGIEAGLIVGLLGITAWTNTASKKIESDASNPPSPIIVQKAETVTSGTKADTLNADTVGTVNAQTINTTFKEPSDAK